MKLKAPAKLNLYLDVTGKRENGYHDLESEVVFLELADEVSVEENDEVIVEGTSFPDEITLKAANLISTEFALKNQGAKIRITKNIPSGAGLGGGSADAAAAIILLMNLWEINCSNDDLYKLGLKLGADVPACLYHQLTHMNSVHFSGIGEILTPVEEKKDMYFVLVNPNKALSTKDVFTNLELDQNLKPKTNHLEETAIKLLPEIADILNVLRNENPELARMTGSGATCFGIFGNEKAAKQATDNIKNHHPEWWVRMAPLCR